MRTLSSPARMDKLAFPEQPDDGFAIPSFLQPLLDYEPSSEQLDDGIAIPSFLQPLLGLDFVPYMPPRALFPGEEESESMFRLEQNSLLTDEDLEDLGLQIDGNQRFLQGGSHHEEKVEPDTLTAEEEASSSLKPPKPLHKRLGKLVRRKRDSASKPLNRSRVNSWDTRFLQTPTGRKESKASNNSMPDFHKRESKVTTPSSNKEALAWLGEQQRNLNQHQSHLHTVQSEAQAMQSNVTNIQQRVGNLQNEISQLQEALQQSQQKLTKELQDFEKAKQELNNLETSVLAASQAVVKSIRQMQKGIVPSFTPLTPPLEHSSSDTMITPKANNSTNFVDASVEFPLHLQGDVTPLRPRAATAPAIPTSASCSSFMRVHDLEIDTPEMESASVSSSTSNSLPSPNANDFVFFDHNVINILTKLSKLGFEVATDETKRFEPTRDTERLLARYESKDLKDNSLQDWPIKTWHAVHGKDVLIWTGGVNHDGFGSDWPVCKARAIVQAPSRVLLDYLMDNSKVKEYNSMSQGRKDVLVIQDDVDMLASESRYGFSGHCRIVKTLNKPRLLPTTIEMISLNYTQPLEIAPNSYMMVQRSVFEDDSGEHKGSNKNTIRSEMLLGVVLIRPADPDDNTCELTNVTHVYSPGVPEMLAKRVAPSQASSMVQAIQSVFKS